MIDLLFGFNDNIDLVVKKIEKLLDIALEHRNSGWRGGDYYSLEFGDSRSVYVQRNADLDELAEEEFPDFNFLVYIAWFGDEQKLINALSSKEVGCTLLKKRHLNHAT